MACPILLGGGLPVTCGAQPDQQPYAQPDQEVTLTVFFEGTGNALENISTQISLFHSLVRATDISAESAGIPARPMHLKMAFDGCGVAYGLTGALFGAGLEPQCRCVERRVQEVLRLPGVGSIQVNAVGLSRGAVACIYLCQILAKALRVSLNVLLFDPVPGNLLVQARYLDPFGMTNANRAMDLSKCGNVRRVLALYTHEPLPDLLLHAPVVPRYPEGGCRVEEDVILGCHQGALLCQRQPDCLLSFAYIRNFLLDTGTLLHACPQMEVAQAFLLRLMGDALQESIPTRRSAHSGRGKSWVVRHERAQYLNRSHRQLAERLHQPDMLLPGADKEVSFLREFLLEVTDVDPGNLAAGGGALSSGLVSVWDEPLARPCALFPCPTPSEKSAALASHGSSCRTRGLLTCPRASRACC